MEPQTTSKKIKKTRDKEKTKNQPLNEEKVK